MTVQNNLHESLLKTGKMLDEVNPNALTAEQIVELLKTQSNLESLRDSIVLSMDHKQTIDCEQKVEMTDALSNTNKQVQKVAKATSPSPLTPHGRTE